MVVDAVSTEKDVAKSVIFEAIEAALASATKKRNREDIEVRVSIDRETGDYETYRCWEIMPDGDEILDPVTGRPSRFNHRWDIEIAIRTTSRTNTKSFVCMTNME